MPHVLGSDGLGAPPLPSHNDSARKRQPNFTAAQMIAILREVLLEREPVSAVCERHRIQPSQFYRTLDNHQPPTVLKSA